MNELYIDLDVKKYCNTKKYEYVYEGINSILLFNFIVFIYAETKINRISQKNWTVNKPNIYLRMSSDSNTLPANHDYIVTFKELIEKVIKLYGNKKCIL